MNLDALRKIIKEELVKEITAADPNKPRYNPEGLKDNSVNGILNILKNETTLFTDTEVKRILGDYFTKILFLLNSEDKLTNNIPLKTLLKRLDIKDLNSLNTKIQGQSSKTSSSPGDKENDTAKKADIKKYGSKGL